MDVIKIGKCSCCEKMGRIVGTICKNCEDRYGARLASVFARVRKEPDFRQQCYLALPDGNRALFVEMFGRPDVDE